QGKVVLVKFWATDCTTCVAQMPDNIENFNAMSGKGFDIVAVAMKHDPINYVRNFTQSRQLPFTVVHDDKGEIAKAFGDVRLTPTALFHDKHGQLINRYQDNYDKQEFIATTEKALARRQMPVSAPSPIIPGTSSGLGFSLSERIDVHHRFADLGLDSQRGS